MVGRACLDLSDHELAFLQARLEYRRSRSIQPLREEGLELGLLGRGAHESRAQVGERQHAAGEVTDQTAQRGEEELVADEPSPEKAPPVFGLRRASVALLALAGAMALYVSGAFDDPEATVQLVRDAGELGTLRLRILGKGYGTQAQKNQYTHADLRTLDTTRP